MLDNKWHYTDKNDYPEVFGKYEDEHYPQIPDKTARSHC